MSKKVMISQPMAGKSEDEIIETRNKFLEWAEENGYEAINTLFTDEWYSEESMLDRGVTNAPVCFLAKSVESMSKCDIAYFAKGWSEARGCRIEHTIAVEYGLGIKYESPLCE